MVGGVAAVLTRRGSEGLAPHRTAYVRRLHCVRVTLSRPCAPTVRRRARRARESRARCRCSTDGRNSRARSARSRARPRTAAPARS
ncbi:hypothetical protein BVI1335_3320002 [Burkholderia vietnamiensis]|nr:hypothetical protein BVI1335_3320002 [Burkholderia vietnamiensis]